LRAVNPILSVSSAFDFFPLLVVSVWENAEKAERKQLRSFLLSIVRQPGVPLDILEVITKACDSMDRANFALFKKAFGAGEIAERCNSWFSALRFFGKAVADEEAREDALVRKLKIRSRLKRTESAAGLGKMLHSQDNAVLLEQQAMWDAARRLYDLSENDEASLAGYLRCSMWLADWDAIMNKEAAFRQYSQGFQAGVAICFAAAAESTGKDASKFLSAIRFDDKLTCMWRSIIALNHNELDTALRWIKQGFALQSLDVSVFAAGSYEPAIPDICTAMVFEELRDVADQRLKKVTDTEILGVWNRKADYVKRETGDLQNIFRVRDLLDCGAEEKLLIRIHWLDALRECKVWTIFDHNFNRSLEKSEDDRVKLMRARFRYDRGVTSTPAEFEEIIYRLKGGAVFCEAVCALCSRVPASPELVPLLETVIAEDSKRIRAWKHWAYVNLALVPANPEFYADNALHGFAELVDLSSELQTMRYLCQLCSLFFQYGPRLQHFEETANRLTSLRPSAVIQIIPQLMAQLNHSDAEVVKVVLHVIEHFAVDHFQALALPLCLLERTNPDSIVRRDFMDKMQEKHGEVMHDAEIFTAGMLRLANTPTEEIIKLLEKIELAIMSRQPIEKINKLFDRLQERCEQCPESVSRGPLKQSRDLKTVIASARDRPFESQSQLYLARIEIQDSFDKQLAIETEELISAPALAMPGFYSVEQKVVLIIGVGRYLKLLPSAKRPRKVRVRGDNGQTYKYLLKGYEDLRLDQRVVQLFLLVNSILHEDTFGANRYLEIKPVPVVPLAPTAGLIGWAEGGDTLYSIISWHRTLRPITNNETEDRVVNALVGGKEKSTRLTSLQKYELHLELCRVSPGDEIREAIWLKSPNTEIWVGQTSGFARSNALMSIVGYIMGIGDRHPSNILVMKRSYTVVHIDFSDCFEKASLRGWIQETVPFRLTRMLVTALGISGFEGEFAMTAEYVMELMRKNRETLLAFLDIFTQDPIRDSPSSQFLNEEEIEPESTPGNNFEGARRRVAQKLTGEEFGTGPMNAHDQVRRLIAIATDHYNLAQMYYGWAPYW
jgi:hypothetical protein